MKSKRTLLVTALTLLWLVAAGCSSAAQHGEDGETDVPAGAQRLTVTVGDSLEFEPVTLAVQAGRPVLLTVRNAGKTDHDFVIKEMPASNVRSRIEGGHGHAQAGEIVAHPKAGSAVTVRFTPIRAGTYEFYCSVAGHRGAGMTGALTVT